jgi:asparagine synthase (glutamine-hydrolysing)
VAAAGDTPSHLIAAAYQAWGDDCAAHLEGDFSFLLWDRRERRLLAARDLTGTRPLCFTSVGPQLVLATSLASLAAFPGVSRQLNQAAIAETIISAASYAVDETEFTAMQRLPAGHRLTWRPGEAPRVERFAAGPRFDQGSRADLREGGARLRETLGAAVRERMAGQGTTTVWMSGGYDSPSIFALANRAAGTGQQVRPVSMSYPEGDTGREDELIQAVADFHRVPVEWIQIGDVAGHRPLPEWAGERDESFAHHYEPWNRALSQGSRRAGGRIALSGNGGDQFFSVSPVFLADLLRTGRWLTLAREARALGFRPRGYRELFHWALQPNLSAGLHRLIGMARGGRPLRPHLQAAFPDWFPADPALRRRLRERQWHYGYRRPGEPFSSAESNWYLNTSFGQRVSSLVSTIAHGEGVEVRSPMYDRRVLELLASRHRADRFGEGENKQLLRAALDGLLPSEHLARRRKRTGLPGGYLVRVLPQTLELGMSGLGASLRLADLGVLEPVRFRAIYERYQRQPQRESNSGAQLFEILAVEYWLRRWE